MNGLEASSTWDVYAVGGRVASADEDCVILLTGSQSGDHEFQYLKEVIFFPIYQAPAGGVQGRRQDIDSLLRYCLSW